VENLREGNEERAKWGDQMLELRELFHCEPGKVMNGVIGLGKLDI